MEDAQPLQTAASFTNLKPTRKASESVSVVLATPV